MKRILITAKHSYIGGALASWLSRFPQKYQVDCISQRTEAWKETDFSGYDAVVDVTGIAHVDVRETDADTEREYYRVNCELAVETAKLAREAGVKQFVFMSSIIVYGDSAPVGSTKRITAETSPAPAGFYGKSKLLAEQKLFDLETELFRVAAVRAPMVYGAGCGGNYPKLGKIAKCSPVFPKVRNERSMIYIEHLCEFLRLLLEHGDRGVFCPQNREWVQTGEMVRLISHAHKLPLVLVPGFERILRRMAKYNKYVNKVFGNLAYEPELSDIYGNRYQLYSFAKTIWRTEQ